MTNLTIHPIGNKAIVLDEARQSIFTLDLRSAFVLSSLSEGCQTTDLTGNFTKKFNLGLEEADFETSRIIKGLQDLGLLNDRTEHSIDPAEEAVSLAQTQPRVVPQREATTGDFLCRIRLLDTTFEVCFPCERLSSRFRKVMGHLETDTVTVDSYISVRKISKRYSILVDSIEAEACGSDEQVAPQIMSVVSAQAVNRCDFAACIHAAVILVDGQSVLVPGPSGTGKSCFALALASAGFTCLTDEKALLDRETLQVRGVPLACCVKEGAWKAMTPLHPDLLEAAIHTRGDGKRVKYLDLVSPDAAEQSWPVDHIVFPTFREGAVAGRSSLEPTEALSRLLASCLAWRAPLTPTFVKTLISWIERVQAHELQYGSVFDASTEFSQLLGRKDVTMEVRPSS